MDIREKVDKVTTFLSNKVNGKYEIAIITGSGFDKLAESVEREYEFSYSEIPHYPCSTAPGHKGTLLFGKLAGKKVIVFVGRFHAYEGYDFADFNIPPRIMKNFGVKTLIITNAAGGVNPNYYEGDPVLIKDHINLMGDNPLIGKNDDRVGPRFPDMSDAYNRGLRNKIKDIALKKKIYLHEGVYLGLKGPNLETNAEYRMIRVLGGDLVGMSTVPEVISAVHTGLDVLAFSIVSNRCIPDALTKTTGESVLAKVEENSHKVVTIIKGFLEEY